MDVSRAVPVRLARGQLPIWSPDGSRVAFNAQGLYQTAASGVGEPELLLKGGNFSADWSPDGRFILYWRRGEKTRGDIWVLPLFGDRKEYPLLNSAADEFGPRLSPDGRSLAYSSDESGDREIYVRSFTADGKLGADRKRISPNGGADPVWRADGQELYYLAPEGRLMAVAVSMRGGEREYGVPGALFPTRTFATSWLLGAYDVAPDGKRFLMGTVVGESKTPPPSVILNWTAELTK